MQGEELKTLIGKLRKEKVVLEHQIQILEDNCTHNPISIHSQIECEYCGKRLERHLIE